VITQGSRKYPVTEIMLHTSATPTNWHVGKGAVKIRNEIDRWHKARGWRGIGYHRVFIPDGKKANGRSIYTIGAGCAGRNRGVIHLCLVPHTGIQSMGAFEDFYTEEQRKAVKDYIKEVVKLNGKGVKVTGHNDFSSKLCPGFKVISKEWGGI